MSHTRKLASIILSIIITLSMALTFGQPRPASAQGDDDLKRQLNAQTGKVSFIVPANGRSLSAAKALGISPSARLADPARALINRFAPEFGLRGPNHELSEIDVKSQGNGRVTVRYQQNYQGIPVLGGELIVNMNENGDLYSINGEVSSSFSLQTQPTIDSEQARQTALQSMAKWYQTPTHDFVASEPTLWMYDESLLQPSTRPAELVWRLEVTAVDAGMPVRELVLINAERGNISLHFNQVDTLWHVSNQAATTQVKTSQKSPLQAAGAVVKTYTAGNSTTLPGTFLCDQTTPNCPPGDSHAKAAHKYAIGTYNLYQTSHNRISIDNNNMPVISTVHYDFEYQNAFWSGSQMVYGDGFGFALADDVVAHELTHGVTQHESNLFYYYQSGAINESFSDLWGEYYDQTNGQGNDDHGSGGVKWLIGENISGLGAIRSMSTPPDFSNPDKMSSIYYYEFSGDNGGVHFNSGVNNKAVYLMVDGGAFNGKTVTALGWAKTAAIYYEVNTNLLPSGADYSDLYFALQQSCSNLIGQKGITAADCQEVKDATEAVEMHLQPAPNFNTDAPLCDAGTPSIAFADDLENGAGKWTFTNGGTTRWQIDSPFYGPYAQSGIHSLYADDFPAAIADVNARLAPFTVPSNAYLHFSHAFDFESFGDPYHFDGGVLEYTTDGGSTWLDAGSLITFNGYKGTIFTVLSNNPLKGRSAFVGSSHGYISTRLDLSTLAGQTVSFRWRMGLDEFGFAWGWWVDTVQLYTCINTPATATLLSPSGDIGSNYSPTYTWNKVSNATWYYLWVDGPSGNVINKWYQASLICGANTCSATPDTTLKGGAHTFWVRTWNSSGHGAWSTGMSFRTAIPTRPGKAILINPSGNIGDNHNPTYTWNMVSGATWYYLWVNGPTGNAHKQWYSASTICDSSECSVTPATTLGDGTYNWWVQTWNSAGYGAWSTGMSFSVTTLNAATLVSPNGSITVATPEYNWNSVDGATWYYLRLSKINADGSLTMVHSKWYAASQVCSGTTCSLTPAVTLASGHYRWWIQAWGTVGYSPWSNPTDFSAP